MAKKLLPLYIIGILKSYSDQNHRLLQKDIISLIENNYNEKFERKSISRCIDELIEFGYDINYDKGYYLDIRRFDKSELIFFADVILNSQILTQKQAQEIMDKLFWDESEYDKRAVHKIHNISRMPYSENPEFFLNIEMINEAIENNRKIAFNYKQYGLDKKLHMKRDRKYVVNPYEVVVSMNKYYLIGNYDKYDNITNYRIDKICNVEILNEPIKRMNKAIDLPKYKLEHLYMFSGPSVHVKLKFENGIIDQVIDWFSTEATIIPIDTDYSYLIVDVNEKALYYWLKQFNEHVERME